MAILALWVRVSESDKIYVIEAYSSYVNLTSEHYKPAIETHL